MKREQGAAVAEPPPDTGPGEPARVEEGARKRAAVELIRANERALRRTARRYSLCEDDADDAYQRGLEILLTKAPTADPRELIRWTQTVVKHEALAVRRNRERTLGTPPDANGADAESRDWVQLIPSERDGPADLAERRERVARSREALQALKPQELRALTLLAEGYSYSEIGEITGFSRTKINRCLAEGRGRFKALLSSSESGGRCAELESQLSAFCDGETSPAEVASLREHLRACAHCRSTLRAYRAAPGAAAALAPALPALPESRSLLERAGEMLTALQARLPGRTGAVEAAAAQVATGSGGRGTGMAAMAKLLALCAGTAGGAACVASGVAPVPLVDIDAERVKAPATVRAAPELPVEPAEQPPAPVVVEAPSTSPEEEGKKEKPAREPAAEPAPAPSPSVEFSPEASVSAAPAPAPVSGSSGGESAAPGGSTSTSAGAAGEFGP